MLSDAALRRIDREVAKYPPGQKQSAVMSALAIAQDEKGWLPPETMDFVAQYLDMPPVAVYEVATFYAMYNRQPVRKIQDHDLHEPSMCAAGCGQVCRIPEGETRHRLRRDDARRTRHAAGGRMHGRLR